ARLPASAGGIDVAARVMLPGPNGLVVGVFGPATVFLGAVSAALAATLLGSDFRSGTIRPQLIAHPARYSFLAGKLAVLAAYLLVLAALAVVVASLAGIAFSPGWAHDHGWLGSAAAANAARTIPGLWLAMLAYGSIGALAGLVLRSPGPAAVAAVLYVASVDGLIAEAVQQSRFGDLAGWLPQAVLTSLSEGGDGHLLRSVLMAMAIVVILLAVGTLNFVRRDAA
ncbi:MAG: hypothetical protein J2P45_17040, partial [Candidatus Dormibacteraeota bacterium]|nr:hypothetical protein [Candidatus Dormibacteraeota bacterium]